ncbi:retinoblastoma family protein [Lucilia sericata]|uniref:retinoblastoma family protein n=1 Tax=Lucilia sericata TaxID=13632 RepID=UPI0018A7F41B|nr:retinoblastoma family protein [Lucilia sericata]
MTQSREDGNDPIRSKYEDLCRELNMDRETEELSWKKYIEISKIYSLEGDHLHWFCCALYAACRISYTPTVGGGSNDVVLGNCISVIKLLRSCNIGIHEFTSKMRKWHDMAKLPESFLNQINKMERSYNITSNVFMRYSDIFEQLFMPPPNEKKNCKFRSAKCPYGKLFEICWCLYLCAKNENPVSQVTDIVMSFHLLICCIDLIYKNVLAENPDLINTKFVGTPPKWGKPDFDARILKDYCIIEPLCNMSNASPHDAKNMKDTFKRIIKKFLDTNTLYGSEETLVSNKNFERNLRSLKGAYEQYVLNMAELDERILLDYRKINNNSSHDSSGLKIDMHPDIKSLMPNTPYTRKESLPSKDGVFDPVANATNNVKKLREISTITEPSEFIRNSTGEDVIKRIEEKLIFMSKLFYNKFPNKEESVNKFQLAKSLYYYLLDKILNFEIRIKPIDLKSLFQKDSFNTTLIACSVEIVLDAYDSPLKFPWILDCFSINAFEFYKLIEIIVRSHDGVLNRELIKHLNLIEETCLESLAWQKCSPLWELIKKEPTPLPTWSEVKVGNIDSSEPQLQSPMNSAYDTFSTSTTTVSDSVRRDLFNTSKETIHSLDKPNNDNQKQINANKRSIPLKLFLRKFYKLSWLRIKELCKELELGDEMISKIWTLFEYSITQKTELMQDRHLDQIFMCAIYLYIKVGEVNGKLFRDIMKFYRKQPQATSSIYREVFIKVLDSGEKKLGDIIQFYNEIYMQKMTPYAWNFSRKQDKPERELLLSPHPPEKQNFPRQISNNHSLFVHSIEKKELDKYTASPNQLTFQFSRSPGKELEKMSAITSKGKRAFTLIELSDVDRKRARGSGNQALLKIMKDRQEERN